MGSKANNDIIT